MGLSRYEEAQVESFSNKELEALSRGGSCGRAGVWFAAHNRFCCRNPVWTPFGRARFGLLWRRPHRMRLRILSMRNTIEKPS